MPDLVDYAEEMSGQFYEEQVSEDTSEGESSEEETSEEEGGPEEETVAEREIEGDFEYVEAFRALSKLISIYSRIIQGIRGQDAASGAAVLSKDWDFNFVAEKEAEFRDDLREASGVGRKKKKVCG
jgi:general transcription factor 3C polypeptide 3 (transcription factor C subunit 4)